MNKITVHLLPPTESGRIHYFRDPEIEQNILYIRRNIHERAAHIINIDSIVMITLDNNSILQSLECVRSRKIWRVQNEVSVPADVIQADVEFLGVDKGLYLELPVIVMTDKNYSFAQVLIGNIEPTYKWIALSDQCYALVSGNNFQGYYVRLTE
jgi:hypothetical protein